VRQSITLPCSTVLAIAVSLGSSWPAGADPLSVSVAYGDVASPPWFLGDGTAVPPAPGVAVLLLNAAMSACHLQATYSRWPDKRLYASMAENRFDAAFMFSYSKARERFFVYPMQGNDPDPERRITSFVYSFYVAQDSPAHWNGRELEGASVVGVNTGWSIGTDLAAKGMTVEEAPTTDVNFRKLQAGRIAAYATQDHVGDHYLESHQGLAVTKLQPPISRKDYYVVFGKAWYAQHKADGDCLWQQIHNLRERMLPGLLSAIEPDQPGK
jgi:polar amino acid transport system substrate-binding protein